MRVAIALLLGTSLALSACGKGTSQDAVTPTSTAGVDAARIIAAKPAEWLSTGRTYDEQRFSPLSAVNQDTVGKLGLAWSAEMDTNRGQEATPLFIDGTLYVSTAWSMVKAYDARSGKLLWSYDPQVPRETLVKACCDAVNRGVAAWGDKIFVGTLDGRLIAIDRKSGKPVWSKVTLDQTKNYTITGAPRVVNGMVVIGNGGAEFGARGYVAPMTPKPARRNGNSTPSRPSQARRRKRITSRRRPPPGMGSGGNRAGAAPCGTPWPMIRSWTCSISASAMARLGTRPIGRRAKAIISISLPSSRCMRRQANMPGIIRPRRATAGTLPPPSISCWPTWRWTDRRKKC